MLSHSEIESNKKEYLNLVSSINRPYFNKEGLIEWLNNSDFFTAPASTKYHEAYEGGLCEHSLNVYYELYKLVSVYGVNVEEDSIKIVALFHDISKANYYEKYSRNVKQYSDDGNQQDNKGRFSWVSKDEYKVRDTDERLLFGNHEMTSEFITRQFIPLSIEESVAILHHMGKMSADCAQHEITPIFTKYHLALLLHLADMTAVYLTPVITNNNNE